MVPDSNPWDQNVSDTISLVTLNIIHLIFKLLIVEDNEINEHTLNWEFLHQFDIKEEKKRKWANEE